MRPLLALIVLLAPTLAAAAAPDGAMRTLMAAAQPPAPPSAAASSSTPARPAPGCTTAAIMATAQRAAAPVTPSNPASWPVVEVTVGPGGDSRCRRIAQVFSALQDVQPLRLTVTLDPSVEYIDDTSSHFHQARPGGTLDWPPFEQIIRGWTLIRSRDPARLAVLRSGPGSLYYGKGILVLDPAYDGADQTLENIHLIGVRRATWTGG